MNIINIINYPYRRIGIQPRLLESIGVIYKFIVLKLNLNIKHPENEEDIGRKG